MAPLGTHARKMAAVNAATLADSPALPMSSDSVASEMLEAFDNADAQQRTVGEDSLLGDAADGAGVVEVPPLPKTDKRPKKNNPQR